MSETTEAQAQDDQDAGDRENDRTDAPAEAESSDDGGEASDAGEDGDDADEEDGDKPKKKSLFKRPIFWIILAVVVAVVGIGGFLYYQHAQQFESTDDAFVDAHIVRIAPQVAGTLVRVADVDNRHIAAGTLLAEIEPSGQEDQVAEAQANVAQAQQQYGASLSQVSSALADRQQASAQALSPAADAAKARDDLQRYLALRRLDPAAVAQQQIDDARAAVTRTAALAAAARRNVDSADAAVDVARDQSKVSRAAIAARRAQLGQSRTTAGNLRLTAPIAGQVVNRQVNIGSYVQPGTQLMAIVPERMWVTANFKETQLARMRIGQPVDIKVDAYPDVEFKGHIDSFQNGAGQAFALLPPQNATGNYVKVVQRVPVRIVFDVKGNPDPRRYPIGPGMSVIPTVKVE